MFVEYAGCRTESPGNDSIPEAADQRRWREIRAHGYRTHGYRAHHASPRHLRLSVADEDLVPPSHQLVDRASAPHDSLAATLSQAVRDPARSGPSEAERKARQPRSGRSLAAIV